MSLVLIGPLSLSLTFDPCQLWSWQPPPPSPPVVSHSLTIAFLGLSSPVHHQPVPPRPDLQDGALHGQSLPPPLHAGAHGLLLPGGDYRGLHHQLAGPGRRLLPHVIRCGRAPSRLRLCSGEWRFVEKLSVMCVE